MKYHEYFVQRRETLTSSSRAHPLHSSLKISVIVPVYNIEKELLFKCVDSALAQIFPVHEVILVDDGSTRSETIEALAELKNRSLVKVLHTPENLNISGASNFGVNAASGDFLFFLDNDDEIPPYATDEILKTIELEPATDLLYGDENKIEADGSFSEPYYKPDWSPEHLTSVMYALHPLVIRKSLFQELGGFREAFSGTQDFDLFLRASLKARKVSHVREVIYHWRKIEGSAAARVDAKPYAFERARTAIIEHYQMRGIEARVENGLLPGTFRARPKIVNTPLISIVIPTDYRTRDVIHRGLICMINHLVKSIREKSTYSNYEILVVDNANVTPENRAYLAGMGVRIIHYPDQSEKFNFSNRVNHAVKSAKGDFILMLNDDMEIITADWMEAMVEFAQLKEVGLVGAKLIYPIGTIQHAGVIFRKEGESYHAMHDYPVANPGHNGFACLIRNYMAMTGACVMIRKSVWDQVGGLDPVFAIDYNDIDLCLRIYSLGLRLVFTPYAQLYHYHQSSAPRKVQDPMERKAFFERWIPLVYHDPYSNYPDVRFEDASHPF